MRRFDLPDGLVTVATLRRTGAGPGSSLNGWLAPLAVLAFGCIALAAV